jgi:hypothetical protein
MAFTDLLPDRPLTREEFQALERNENIDALETDEAEGPVAAFSVVIGDSEANYHYAQGMGWHKHGHGHGHHH